MRSYENQGLQITTENSSWNYETLTAKPLKRSNQWPLGKGRFDRGVMAGLNARPVWPLPQANNKIRMILDPQNDLTFDLEI